MDSFIFKGISSTDFNGIVVNSLPPISKPPKRVNKIQIDGRDGDITEFLGYDSYEKEIEITVLKETNIDELIKWLNGKGTLVLSNEPDKCYEAEIINQIDFSRLEKYEKNKIKFHCQPFKHLLNETELKKENLSKTTSGTSIDLNDSTEMRCELKISGNSEQETRSGKNLIRNENKDVGDNSYWYLYSTYDKETYTMTRSTTATTESFIAYRIGNGIIKNNTQYTISFEAKKNEYVKSFEVLLIGYNTTGIKTKTIGITNEFQKYSYTFTTDATADYKSLSQIRFDNNGSTESGKEAILTIKNVMLVEGTDTGFEQYGAMPSPDYPSEIKTVGSNGCVKVTKCNKNIWNLGNKGNNSGDISFPLKSGKYTLSFKKKRISNSTITNAWVYRYAYIRFYDKNDTLLSSIKDGMAINLTANQTSDRQIIDFTAPENTVKMNVNFSNNNGDNNNNTEAIEIQLEGEKATSFEQHEEQSYIMPIQQPMRSIGDIRDTFIKKDDKWYERHYIARKIFDGTESFGDILSNNKRYYFMYNALNPLPKAISNNGITPEILSNKLTKVSVNNLISSNKQGIAYNTEEKVYIYTETTSTMNNAQFRTWLSEQYNAGTPLYVDYILKTPLDIECTEEQSRILDELNNARTYKNVTHIYSTDKISSYKEVTYYLDNRLTITNAGNTESKPVIKIYGKDDIYMYLNDIQVLKIELGNEEYITIDTEKMEAYKDTLDVLKNRLVTGNYDNILLKQGQNILYFEGKVSKVEVSNYSRWT